MSRYQPEIPKTFETLGISETSVTDLILRRMLIEGQSTLENLTVKLRLSMGIVDHVFRQMRQQQLVEVKGMRGNDYFFVLSQSGRQYASERWQLNHYAGACPVSLDDYYQATKLQAADVQVDRESLRHCFSDLVVTDHMLDQLGPALISQTSIFVYGPTGNGKTSLAERMLRVYHDGVLIPYAVEVDNQVISVFDPVVHERLPEENDQIDPRWVYCKRPCIVVGGELMPNMLELRLDDSSGIYSAPLQMKANNGIFIIDDFGRQLISPRDLLNRWIVPLDRRVDYLSLRYGVKFQIPFELMVVFSTNLEPTDLADEAFLRRIHNKIYVESIQRDQFDHILERVFYARQFPMVADTADLVRELCTRDGRTELRACYPNDICNILAAISSYENRPVSTAKPDLERACQLYFAKT